MTTDVKFVVGLNYGDEGKGAMSNYYTRIAKQNGKSVLNVLYNGGAQRGHTAQGHVFHCFGAGALRGADTYYTRNFMLNPIAWWFEFKELDQKPMLYVNQNCRITTPYDVRINQLLEESRGNKRHGSCGLGIFETRKRCEETKGIYASDLKDSENLYKKLKLIKDIWVPARCKELGIEYTNDNSYELDNFITCVEQMLKSGKVKVVIDDDIMLKYDTVIFEGGQGIMLSESNKKDFPHLTPSITEFKGAQIELEFLYHHTDAQFEFCMMTRPYLTRHGAGPLPNECKKEVLSDKIVDETNMPNEWQGNLRFAPFDDNTKYRLRYSASDQFFSLSLGMDHHFYDRVFWSIGITCLDQTDGNIVIANFNNPFDIPHKGYIKLDNRVPYNLAYIKYNEVFSQSFLKLYGFFGKDTLPVIHMPTKPRF